MRFALLSVSALMVVYGLAAGRPAVAALYALPVPFYALPRSCRRLPGWGGEDGAARVDAIERRLYFMMVFNALGTVALHRTALQYDRWLHLYAVYAGVMIAFTVLRPGPGWAPVRTDRLLPLLVAAGIAGSLLVEVGQYSGDRIFGTRMFHDVSQTIERDVTEDLAFDAIGIVAAVIAARRALRRERIVS